MSQVRLCLNASYGVIHDPANNHHAMRCVMGIAHEFSYPHISHLANKKLKSLLHMCALNAVKYDPQLKQYYQRKVEEGKHKMNVLNNVRNKLIHRIYAVITTGQEYDKNYYLRNISVAA